MDDSSEGRECGTGFCVHLRGKAPRPKKAEVSHTTKFLNNGTNPSMNLFVPDSLQAVHSFDSPAYFQLALFDSQSAPCNWHASQAPDLHKIREYVAILEQVLM